MISPKTSVRINSDADRQRFLTAVRAIIKEHRDVIRALAKR
jgi:hypothetical protein